MNSRGGQERERERRKSDNPYASLSEAETDSALDESPAASDVRYEWDEYGRPIDRMPQDPVANVLPRDAVLKMPELQQQQQHQEYRSANIMNGQPQQQQASLSPLPPPPARAGKGEGNGASSGNSGRLGHSPKSMSVSTSSSRTRTSTLQNHGGPSRSAGLLGRSSSGGALVWVPPDIPASNYVHIERKSEKIRGQFLIDPTMPMPASFFEPVGAAEQQQTTSAKGQVGWGAGLGPGLHTRHDPYDSMMPYAEPYLRRNGSEVSLDDTYLLKDGKPRPNLALQSVKGISVEVWLVNADSAMQISSDQPLKRKKALVELSVTDTVNNAVTEAKMHAQEDQLFALNISHNNTAGTIRIWVPSSFVGPITIDNGAVTVSPRVKAKFSTVSHVENKHRCFIGDIRSFTAAGQREWAGSTITLRFKDGGNGKVDIRSDDETGERSCCIQ